MIHKIHCWHWHDHIKVRFKKKHLPTVHFLNCLSRWYNVNCHNIVVLLYDWKCKSLVNRCWRIGKIYIIISYIQHVNAAWPYQHSSYYYYNYTLHYFLNYTFFENWIICWKLIGIIPGYYVTTYCRLYMAYILVSQHLFFEYRLQKYARSELKHGTSRFIASWVRWQHYIMQ